MIKESYYIFIQVKKKKNYYVIGIIMLPCSSIDNFGGYFELSTSQ